MIITEEPLTFQEWIQAQNRSSAFEVNYRGEGFPSWMRRLDRELRQRRHVSLMRVSLRDYFGQWRVGLSPAQLAEIIIAEEL